MVVSARKVRTSLGNRRQVSKEALEWLEQHLEQEARRILMEAFTLTATWGKRRVTPEVLQKIVGQDRRYIEQDRHERLMERMARELKAAGKNVPTFAEVETDE